VRRVRAFDASARLTELFARRLAVWMSSEDAIRVADLKTRRARFQRIRRESGAPEDAVIAVTDYLKPDLDELYGILPVAVAAPVSRWAERRWPEKRPALGQHVKTTTVLGFLRVWGLGRLRFLRPRSLRYRRESSLMARWERAVLEAATVDSELAVEVVELAAAVKGYGEVRRRLSGALVRVLEEVVEPAISRRETTPDGGQAAEAVRAARLRLLEPEQSAEALFAHAAGA
jgi:indolepyruvate ferredoxin oxidoreductase beta subunit